MQSGVIDRIYEITYGNKRGKCSFYFAEIRREVYIANKDII